jgi:spermidine synthase
MGERVTRVLVYVFFLLSGASALAYEIVWTRQLTLIAGATTPAVSTVLAVFMGGLALGAALFGSIADRGRHLLRWYAAIEVAIGVFALVQPLLLDGMGGLYVRISDAASGASLIALRTTLAATLFLPPTVMMGGTFPILVRFAAQRGERLSRELGGLYATNLAGAVLGAFLTGFVWIRTLGMSGTLALAATVNLTIGLAAFLLSRRSGDAGEPSHSAPAAAAPSASLVPSPGVRVLLMITLALSGFLSMGYEVAWTRVLVFPFGSTVYAFTLILVVFLLGLALGSAVFARLDPARHCLPALGLTQILAAAAALGLLPLVLMLPGWIRDHLPGRTTTDLPLLASAGTAVAIMLLPAMLMGVAFPLASRMLVDDLSRAGRRLGAAYWINTTGSIAGSVLTGFVLIPLLSVKGSLIALAAVQVVLGLVLLLRPPLGRPRAAAAGACAAVACASALVFGLAFRGPSPFDHLFQQSRPGMAPPVVLAHRDDATASVTVVDALGHRTLRINGFNAAPESDATGAGYMPMMSHLPLLLHGKAQRVLVICFGTGSTAGAVLLHPEVHVDVVDINATVLEFAPYFHRTNHQVDASPRARLIHDDGRNYLLRTKERYDVVTSEPMPPRHAGVVNLYSREYYRLARERLRPGGYLVQWLPFHLVSYADAVAIVRAVQDVFPETSLWLHSGTGLIVARHEAKIALDWPTARRAWSIPPLSEDLERLGVLGPAHLAQLFALDAASVREWVASAAPVTDDRPSLEFHSSGEFEYAAFGFYMVEQLRSLIAVHERRAHARVPVTGMASVEYDRLTEGLQVQNARLTGELLLAAGQPEEAARVFGAGLARVSESLQRAPFLCGLAVAARARGDAAAHQTFADLCLAADAGQRAKLLCGLAIEARGRGSFAESTTYAKQCLEADPSNVFGQMLQAEMQQAETQPPRQF